MTGEDGGGCPALIGDARPPSRGAVTKRLIPGLALVAVLVALAFVVNRFVPVISPLALGLAFGVLTAAFGWWPRSTAPGGTFAAKRLLRVGIVLLGFQLSVLEIAGLGLRGLVAVVATVLVTFFGIQLLALVFGVGRELALLVGAGYSICGLSAIAAVKPQTNADEKDVTAAVALVTLCGTLSIVILPALGGLLGLPEETFGSWIGAAVHDVGQAVATSAVVGTVALQSAVIVKLTRVVLLAPLVVGMGVARRRTIVVVAGAKRPPLVPLFVVGFVVAILVRTADVLPATVLDIISVAQKVLLTAALTALGSAVQWRQLRAIGGKVLAFGLTAWVLVGGAALLAVTTAGM